MSNHEDGASTTRERLLEAGAAVFAEKGFRDATVREIVARAGANLNAVNYHFRDKQGLYEAVFESPQMIWDESDDFRAARDESVRAEDRLYAFVCSFLRRACCRGHGPNQARLMAMEIAEPTGVLDMVVQKFVRPRNQVLRSIIRQVVGDHVPEERIELCALSVVGQCLHLIHGRPIITRMFPHLSYSPEGIEQLARHVTDFCLAALKNLPALSEGADE